MNATALLSKGINFICKDLDSAYKSEVVEGFENQEIHVRESLAIESHLEKEGGVAFLWQDILEWGDIIDLIPEFIQHGLSPTQALSIAKNVAKVWQRLRNTRVELSENEFLVLRAIKKIGTRGANVEEVTNYTGLTLEIVDETLKNLGKRFYKNEIPLVKSGQDKYYTEF